MYLRIIAAKSNNAGSIVNKIGKYLKQHIDGAMKIEFTPNTCEVRMRMYYQIPDIPESFREMQFLINITTYQSKIRINITEDTLLEKTIGQIIIKDYSLIDLNVTRKQILDKIDKFITKEYDGYELVY